MLSWGLGGPSRPLRLVVRDLLLGLAAGAVVWAFLRAADFALAAGFLGWRP